MEHSNAYLVGGTVEASAVDGRSALMRLAVSATLHCLTGCAIGEVHQPDRAAASLASWPRSTPATSGAQSRG